MLKDFCTIVDQLVKNFWLTFERIADDFCDTFSWLMENCWKTFKMTVGQLFDDSLMRFEVLLNDSGMTFE